MKGPCDEKEKERLLEAVYEALGDCDELMAIAVLTEAAYLLAASWARSITVPLPLTKEQAIHRLMARSGFDEQKARDCVEWAIAMDEPPRPPKPTLRLV